MEFAIKAKILAKGSPTLAFDAQKTMYDGKRVHEGAVLFMFDSENEGGAGLWGRGVVTSAVVLAKSGERRQTPRVSISVAGITLAARPLGRAELKPFKDWNDGRAETELNFKFYRQATNKLVGLSSSAAEFLGGYFGSR